MKTSIICLATLLVSTAHAEDFSPLAFTFRKFELPALSLLGTAGQNMPSLLDSSMKALHSAASHTERTPKFVSKMPIVAPKKEADARMPIVSPDESIDYKLTTKAPDVASAK